MILDSNIFFFLAAPLGLPDLSSLTSDQTRAPALKAPSPNHWAAREFPRFQLSHQNIESTNYELHCL